MKPVYQIWIATPRTPSSNTMISPEALAFVATTVERRSDAAVASWSLLRALPNGDEMKTIAVGADLAHLAHAGKHAIPHNDLLPRRKTA